LAPTKRSIGNPFLARGAWRAQIKAAVQPREGGIMKRSALTLSILGLTAFAAPALAEDPSMKTEKKVETESTPGKSTYKSDSTSKMKTGAGTTEDKTQVEAKTKKHLDGTTTSDSTTEKTHKSPHMKSHKSKMTEKTTKDASGNITDQTKTKEMK
jgi:hypothetical protein